ncbi:hypothetical protein VB264_20735 [Arcicella aquatica]|uniref:Replication restart DNA helicase PriA n=1 Tax=Arcicella aquatica TaxID=217141 RepID=A0ABU5QT10_9BACT|nr:hypothetical protein [Arcicella aquatica]MEA5260237.1 hypothetical protein [Arcicella aquatica]
MEENNKRYIESKEVRWTYKHEYLVHCPKCLHEALVIGRFTNRSKLICSSCKFTEDAKELVRYNAIVKRNCDNCGKSIDITIPNNKEKVEELTIPCQHCGIVRTYKPRNDDYRLFYKNSLEGDPVFNLPLWFQCEIRGNLFWAYNREHLLEIKNYVASKLRERQNMTHTTMVERLPNFIKDAKNRDTILKAIDKLLKK